MRTRGGCATKARTGFAFATGACLPSSQAELWHEDCVALTVVSSHRVVCPLWRVWCFRCGKHAVMAAGVIFGHVSHHKIHAYPTDLPGNSAEINERYLGNLLMQNLSLTLCGKVCGRSDPPKPIATSAVAHPVLFAPPCCAASLWTT